jgi:hypothetical protein
VNARGWARWVSRRRPGRRACARVQARGVPCTITRARVAVRRAKRRARVEGARSEPAGPRARVQARRSPNRRSQRLHCCDPGRRVSAPRRSSTSRPRRQVQPRAVQRPGSAAAEGHRAREARVHWFGCLLQPMLGGGPPLVNGHRVGAGPRARVFGRPPYASHAGPGARVPRAPPWRERPVAPRMSRRPHPRPARPGRAPSLAPSPLPSKEPSRRASPVRRSVGRTPDVATRCRSVGGTAAQRPSSAAAEGNSASGASTQ